MGRNAPRIAPAGGGPVSSRRKRTSCSSGRATWARSVCANVVVRTVAFITRSSCEISSYTAAVPPNPTPNTWDARIGW